MCGRGIMTTLVAAATAMVLALPAGANTTRDIAKDLKDGRLDATYTKGELEAYIRDAVVQGYGNPVTQPAAPAAASGGGDQPTTGVAGAGQTESPQSSGPTTGALDEVGQVGSLPFTGVDLALLTLGGLALVGLGLGARRFGAKTNRA